MNPIRKIVLDSEANQNLHAKLTQTFNLLMWLSSIVDCLPWAIYIKKQCVMKQQTRYEQNWKGSLGHRSKKQNLNANLMQKFNLAVYSLRRRRPGHGNSSPGHSSWRAKKIIVKIKIYKVKIKKQNYKKEKYQKNKKTNKKFEVSKERKHFKVSTPQVILKYT